MSLNFKNLKFFFVLIALTLFTGKIFAQDDMTPPAPVKNASFDMVLGVWVSDPYDFMGMKWTEEANHYMKHNGQYMVVEVNSKSDKGMTYTATGYITSDKEGNSKSWFFDDWGMTSVGTGKAEGNKISMTSKSDMSHGSLEIEINGDVMVHKGTATWKDKDGKETTQKYEVTYRKKK